MVSGKEADANALLSRLREGGEAYFLASILEGAIDRISVAEPERLTVLTAQEEAFPNLRRPFLPTKTFKSIRMM